MKDYRQHRDECSPLFQQTFNEDCKQQSHQTLLLQKRFVENKAKKAAKKVDKKQTENATLSGNVQSTVHIVRIRNSFLFEKKKENAKK